MFSSLGPGEIILIALVVILLFGFKRPCLFMGRGLPNASEILQIGAWTTLAGIADVEIKTHVALGCTRLKAPTGCKLVSCTATEQISRPKLAHTKTMRKAEAGLVFAFDPEQLFSISRR